MTQQNYNTITSQNKSSLQNPTFMWLPLILTLIIVILDQVTKLLVLYFIPSMYSSNIPHQDKIINIAGDFIWFINVSNKGALFGIGSDFTQVIRIIMLFICPVLLIMYMIKIVLYSTWEHSLRWIAAGIAGGGIGNMIDRFFRPDGVVDFISVKIYGLFGMDRWPTFNVADSAIVVSMILWIIFTLRHISSFTHNHEK